MTIEPQITREEGAVLVKLARSSIDTYLRTGIIPGPPPGIDDRLMVKRGVFVSLYSMAKGTRQLRGCIGYPYPVEALAVAAMKAAVKAATEDPRFKPIGLEELDREIIIELSILTRPRALKASNPAEYPSLIEIGRHGLIVRKGYMQGLLLPQVAQEWAWDAEEFLTHCCLKAGLPPDCWISKDVKIEIFEAQIFVEESPNGPVKYGDFKR